MMTPDGPALLEHRVPFFEPKVWLPSSVHFVSAISSRAVNGHVLSSAGGLICQREATVAALWDQLQKHQVIHVQGTPTSGKSTLARLLKGHVERASPNTKIYSFHWRQPEVLRKRGINGSLYYQLLNFHTDRPIDADDWLNMGNMLLIIDKAEESYQYDNFWTQFIKRISSDEDGGDRRVILFSSYGSQTEIPLIGSPRIELSADQRVSTRPASGNNQKVSLYFTRPEFDDVVTRACRYSGEFGQPFYPSLELLEYIWEFSNGHPEGTRVVLDALMNSDVSTSLLFLLPSLFLTNLDSLNQEIRPYRKRCSLVPLEVALEFLNSDQFYDCLTLGAHGFKWCLPKKDALQRALDITRFLRHVLISGRSEDNVETNPTLRNCCHIGWLQAELTSEGKTVYTFPTKIHQWYQFSITHNHHYRKLRLLLRYAEHLLGTTATAFPKNRFGSIKDLCFAAVAKFSRVALSSAAQDICPDAIYHPMEAQYQKEFYRVCHSRLNVYLTSEWSESQLVGRLNFRIEDMKWVIECVGDGDRDEDKIDEHIKRFQQGGRYYEGIMSGEIEDYIILDFRTSKPRKARGMVISLCPSGSMNANRLDHVPFLYSIVFSNDYTCYQTYDASMQPVGGEIVLFR
jgi:hypothetical protein